MAEQFNFRTSGGSTRIPIANGTHTVTVSENYANTRIYVRFLDANGAEVTPSAGTATFAYQPIGSSQWIACTDPAITATAVKHNALSTYTPPSVTGNVKALRMILASVADAITIEALVVRW